MPPLGHLLACVPLQHLYGLQPFPEGYEPISTVLKVLIMSRSEPKLTSNLAMPGWSGRVLGGVWGDIGR